MVDAVDRTAWKVWGLGAPERKVWEYSYVRVEKVIYRGVLTSVVYC